MEEEGERMEGEEEGDTVIVGVESGAGLSSQEVDEESAAEKGSAPLAENKGVFDIIG